MTRIETIECDGVVLAIILRDGPTELGIHFCTPADYSQQLACMRHPAGHVIPPHVHNHIPRSVHYTQEVLFLRRGRLRVDFYNNDRAFVESRELGPGDVLLLVAGGHGFEVIEEIEMIEVKQGPYAGEMDKTRFPGVRIASAPIAEGTGSR
jgi:mannose-6-phosphate isomerase-like protein (cupin superfamily)